MLDNLVQHSKIEKCFLFDINSKIYVSTDSSPVDIVTYETCAEFVDVTIDLHDLYKIQGKEDALAGSTGNKPPPEVKGVSALNNGVVIYLRQMIRGLALVALIRPDDTDVESCLTVVDYTSTFLRKASSKSGLMPELHHQKENKSTLLSRLPVAWRLEVLTSSFSSVNSRHPPFAFLLCARVSISSFVFEVLRIVHNVHAERRFQADL